LATLSRRETRENSKPCKPARSLLGNYESLLPLSYGPVSRGEHAIVKRFSLPFSRLFSAVVVIA
jgi:hypothetical protein